MAGSILFGLIADRLGGERTIALVVFDGVPLALLVARRGERVAAATAPA